MSITPYSIHIDQTILDDLHERLTRIRWTSPPLEDDWSSGTA